MTLIVTLFIVVLATSFLCSLLEATLLSITPAFVANALKENPRTGQLMDHLKENLDRPLSAILTLNTITQTAGSTLMGAMVHEEFGRGYITAVSVVLTFSVLILAEIIPKMIGANYWRSLAGLA